MDGQADGKTDPSVPVPRLGYIIFGDGPLKGGDGILIPPASLYFLVANSRRGWPNVNTLYPSSNFGLFVSMHFKSCDLKIRCIKKICYMICEH